MNWLIIIGQFVIFVGISLIVGGFQGELNKKFEVTSGGKSSSN